MSEETRDLNYALIDFLNFLKIEELAASAIKSEQIDLRNNLI